MSRLLTNAFALAVVLVLGASAASADAPALATRSPRWSWPVDGPVVIEQAFAAPLTRYSAGHRGIDLRVATGTVVRAPDDATVLFVGVVVDRPVLTLDHGGGVVSSYEPLAAAVGAGERVARGATLGVVSSGGHCDEHCIHVGVREHGQYVSPMLYFARLPRAVLLPLGER